MSTSLVLTVIGVDRPGLVEALSRTLSDYEASWQDSRMSRLAGRFAGILRVNVSPTRAGALEDALRAHHADGLSVVVERGDLAAESTPRNVVSLELLGADRPGIIHEVTGVLADLGINVEGLETGSTRAPMCGGTLFQASATLAMPAEVDIDDLRSALEALGDELMVDLASAESHDTIGETAHVL